MFAFGPTQVFASANWNKADSLCSLRASSGLTQSRREALRKERMRSVSCPFCLHDRNAVFDFLIGHVQPEFATQDILEFHLVCEPALLRTSVRVAYRDARVVHGDPGPARPRLCNDDIALIWRLRVRRGVPVGDLVFTVIARIRNDTVDVMPPILEPRL